MRLGHVDAPALLGQLHMKGIGGPVDTDRAYALFERAVEIGDRDGLLRLGFMYSTGLGVEQSDTEARRYYRRAARKGSKAATRNLIRLAIRTEFEVISYEDAHEWADELARLGDARAGEMRSDIEAARAALGPVSSE